MNDNEIEQEIQAKGKTAPRITPAEIENCIAYEFYVRGTDAFYNYAHISKDASNSLSCLTLCVLVLRNGFTVTGESACVSPENFDLEKGRNVARQKAVDKVWALEGYLLKEKLYRGNYNNAVEPYEAP